MRSRNAMAVQTSFVSCGVGSWTQLCELRTSRSSLVVQLLGGIAILDVDTSGPVADVGFGPVPAGVLHSPTFGNGPATFRLSKSIDDDLVTQSWFAFVTNVPTPAGSPSRFLSGFSNQFGTLVAPTFTLTFTHVKGTLAADLITIGPIAAASNISSVAVGVIMPIATNATPAEAGFIGVMELFAWVHPGGPDTLTFIGPVGSFLASSLFDDAVWGVPGAGSVNAGNGVPVTVSTAPTVLQSGDSAIAAYIGVASLFTFSQWALPFVAIDIFAVADPNGTTWFWAAAAATTPTAQILTASSNPSFGIGDWAAVCEIIAGNGPSGSAVITVIEAFDIDPGPQKPEYFPAELPKLSPDAIAALHDLLGIVQPKQG